MPAGLQVFNDIGTAQITGEEVSLSLVNKFALTLTRRYTSGQQLYYAVNLTIPLDCVLLMGDTSGAYVNVWIDPSSNGTYAQLTSHAGVTVMLYLFAGAPIIASKSGMQVLALMDVCCSTHHTKSSGLSMPIPWWQPSIYCPWVMAGYMPLR